jgi:hypothetical protein
MGNLLRRLALPNQIKDSSLRTMQEKLVKIGATLVSHGCYVTFQMAEVLVSKSLFHEIRNKFEGSNLQMTKRQSRREEGAEYSQKISHERLRPS